jgi:hypothetical protein
MKPNLNENTQQSGPGYDPQAAVMRWLPLATIAILTPGGSILTRDVGIKNIHKETDHELSHDHSCNYSD